MTLHSMRNIRKRLLEVAGTDATKVTSAVAAANYCSSEYADITFVKSAYGNVTFVKSAYADVTFVKSS